MERKERTATDRPWNKFLERRGGNPRCQYYDGAIDEDGKTIPITECGSPWSSRCTGNIFDCISLRQQWLAGLSDEDRKKYEET